MKCIFYIYFQGIFYLTSTRLSDLGQIDKLMWPIYSIMSNNGNTSCTMVHYNVNFGLSWTLVVYFFIWVWWKLSMVCWIIFLQVIQYSVNFSRYRGNYSLFLVVINKSIGDKLCNTLKMQSCRIRQDSTIIAHNIIYFLFCTDK